MTISKTTNGNDATLCIEGRLDTTTVPELETVLATVQEANALTIDCAKLDYISSAGLRVLLVAHKAFSKKGGLTITNVGESICDIFEVTGFNEILNIK